jgi:amidohydrolase
MSRPSLPAVRAEVAAIAPRAIAMRRRLHACPELSWREVETQRVILDQLATLDLQDVRPIAKTGATALVRGKKGGSAVLWRADIDALPIPERTNLPYASTNDGVMHACGHDVHISIGLALAELLSARRDDLRGDVRFVFQPAEEHVGGAQACVAEGVLEEPHIRWTLGLHIAADIPVGAINVAPGPFFAAPTAFRVTITGRGGHAAAPHQSIDAVVVAAHVITALQTVVSRAVPPSESAVVTVGKLSSGFRGNIIADSATMTGTIRTYDERLLAMILERVQELLAGICAAFGATFEFHHNTSCPPLVNDAEMTAAVVNEAERYFGADQIYGAPSMGAEDMSVFLRERPGCFFWLGGRNEAKGIAGRHHDAGFVIDEDSIPLGLEFGLRVIERALSGR